MNENTQVLELDVCYCNDCVQFGWSTHPVDIDQEERIAYTVKTYGSYSVVKPELSAQAKIPADLLKIGA